MDIDELFIKYTNNYNFPECKLKVNHSFRVKDFALLIADELNMDEKERNLVYKSALLHDIGRFEQFKRYHTFVDKDSVYHGDLGVKVLLDKNLIDKFSNDDYEKKVILKTCKYHGTLDKLSDSEEDKIIKIVRDSDKIDILKEALKGNIKLDIDNDFISSVAIRTFKEHKLLNLKAKKTRADRFVVWLCFTFDFNYKYTFRYLKETKLMDKLILKYINKTSNESTKNILKEMGKEINKYINEKVEEI